MAFAAFVAATGLVRETKHGLIAQQQRMGVSYPEIWKSGKE
jgi:hypothetical protein